MLRGWNMNMRTKRGIGLGLSICLVASTAAAVHAQAPRGNRDQPGRTQVEERGRTQVEGRSRIDSRVRTETRVHERSTQLLRSSVFVGSTVNLVGGTQFGTVRDVVISDGGCIDYVIVTYDNRLVPVPWDVISYNFDQHVVMVDIDQAQLRSIPTFTQFSELSNASFVQKVHSFYKTDERAHQRRTNRPIRNDRSGRDDRSDLRRPATREDRGSTALPGARAGARDNKSAEPRSPSQSGERDKSAPDARPEQKPAPKAAPPGTQPGNGQNNPNNDRDKDQKGQ
jgi:hypothetical protein